MADNEKKLWYLRRLNLFEGMAPVEVEAISRRLRERPCHRRDTLLDPQAPGDRIYLVKSGSVRLYRLNREGRELTTAVLRPGQLFGTSSLFGTGDSQSFVEALEECYICEATAEEFLRIMVDHPLLAARMTVMLARQLLRMEQQVERLAFQEVPERLAQALVQLAEDNGGELPPNLTHEELAKLVGTTRETVTKALSQFADRGIVEIGYRKLVILDPEGLHRAAGLDET